MSSRRPRSGPLRSLPLLLLLLLLPLSGCMGWMRGTARSYDLAQNGLSRADDGFRRSLMTGGYASAFARSSMPKAGAPEDPLLRALYRGLTGYYAGEFDETARAFAEADRMTERRLTSSVSRGALSLVTNDRVLPWTPTRTERLFVRYYAMLAYVRAGDMESATVEARRLGRELEDASASVADGEKALHATLRDASGAVFEAAGDMNDALVAYRNAALLRGVERKDVDSLASLVARTPEGDSATLVVLVESGFVAHRVDRGLTIGFSADEWSDSVRPSAIEELARRVDRALDDDLFDGRFDARSRGHAGHRNHDWRRRRSVRTSENASVFVRIAWPALVRSWAPALAAPMQLALPFAPPSDDGTGRRDRIGSGIGIATGADVSAALAADMRRERPLAIARMLARTAAKGAITDALRDRHGDWAGMLASAAGSAMERADTRSWQLLPGALTLVRVVVPAGEHAPVVRVGDGLEAMNVRLPSTKLAAGQVQVTGTRVWRGIEHLGPDTSGERLRTER